MPKEAFGGDGDEGAPPEKKRPGLEKFGLAPDANIKDVFWKIMASYAATKKPGVELRGYEHERFALMRSAVSVLSMPESEHYGLSPKYVCEYTLRMLLDGGWDDAIAELFEEGLDKRLGIMTMIIASMKKIISNEEYRERMIKVLVSMLRESAQVQVIMPYLAQITNPQVSKELKKELTIFARGDIGENQMNAIRAIAPIMDDPDVKKTFIILLSHWDREARLQSASILLKLKNDDDVKTAAKRRMEVETDEEVKKALGRIAG